MTEYKDFVFDPKGYATRVFQMVHDVYYNGELLGTLKSNPHNLAIKEVDQCTFKFENAQLYSDWFAHVETLINGLKMKFDGISKVDIACDGFNLLQPCVEFVRGNIDRVGRSELTPYFRGNKIEGVHIGSRASDKFVRVYCKSAEIESSKKYYIENFWQGLGISGDVERIECSLKSKYLSDRMPVTIDTLRRLCYDTEFLCSLAASAFENLYEFRENSETEKNVTRRARLYQIIWQASTYFIQKVKVVAAAKVRTIQTTMKGAYMMFLRSGSDYYQKIVHEIAHNSDLTAWLGRKVQGWQYEYDLLSRKGAKWSSILQAGTGKQLNMKLYYTTDHIPGNVYL
jgi:hypothetical protein